MRFHQVHTVHNFHHVDKVHFIEHLTIDGQLRVAVGTGHFGGVAFARLPLAGIHFFVTSTHDKLHGLHFPGIVTLNRAGKAQLDAIHRGFTHLFKQQQFSTTNGKFCVQRTVIKPQIHIHRTRHSAAAILLIFAGKFRQRQRLNDPLPVVPVVKQVDALLTGRNQIFLSASKAQAHVFKQYIIDFAKEVEVELKGDPMVLPNGATLYFLGTNARTAQSYHGNLYLDEYFWIPKFQELRKVASGMAIHKKWRQTYFSTPSSLTHSAYPFWSGALFNRGRNKADKVDIDLSHSNLAPGLLCADGQYRQIVTVEDAVRGGCNLFDLDQLRMEYSPDEYQNLLMCEFVDDLASVFPLSELQACMVDSWEVWTDFHALALRPFGWREVWIGYDPAKGTQNGDSAGCVVVAPPAVPGGKFRILERHQWRGMDFRAQADAIKKLTEQYNVTYIGIDSTGVGHGVYENVKAFFPAVREFVYNPNVKNALVLKAYDIISHRRLEFDAGHTDIAQSFMAIRRATTASGNRPTYEASRSEEASHADLAWATMHALFNEPLQGESANTSNIVEIF